MIEGSNILNYIPHRPPMVFLDRLVLVEGLESRSEFNIPEKGIFIENLNANEPGSLSEMGLIEHVAQSAMAFIQFYFKQESLSHSTEDNAVYFGYISSIQSLEIYTKAYVNQKLTTQTVAELVFNSENLKICTIESLVSIEDKPILKAGMKMILHAKA